LTDDEGDTWPATGARVQLDRLPHTNNMALGDRSSEAQKQHNVRHRHLVYTLPEFSDIANNYK